jgi:hypothetical protein
MGLRSRFGFRSIVVTAALFAFIILPVVAWRSVEYAQWVETGGYEGEDCWYAWTLPPTGYELRVHRLRSVSFWKKWPIQVRERSAGYYD